MWFHGDQRIRELQEKGSVVNSGRIAKRWGTKITENISIASGDLKGLSELFCSAMGSKTSLEQVKEKWENEEKEISARENLVNI